MRLETNIKLDFQDVLLKPKRSTISSRKEIGLTRNFNFLCGAKWGGIPIISANMTSITNLKVAEIMAEHKMLACMPKNFHEHNFPEYEKLYGHIISSYGLEEFSEDPFGKMICLDVANGYMEKFIKRVKQVREEFSETIIIAGNVVTPNQTEELILSGADIIKIGLGSGAACSTRLKTGVGYPQLSAILECADAAHGLGGHIISDGGCVYIGDIVKAFAAGADFVMLGSMLAGHVENGVEFYGMASEKANKLYAGGLKDYRAAEGKEFILPLKGSITNILQDIEGGLRSACAYIGAKSIKDLPKCATFIRVNKLYNDSLKDYEQ